MCKSGLKPYRGVVRVISRLVCVYMEERDGPPASLEIPYVVAARLLAKFGRKPVSVLRVRFALRFSTHICIYIAHVVVLINLIL